MDATGKQRELRIPADTLAQLQIFSPFSPDRFTARVLEISKDQLKIGFERFLQPGTVVQIHVKPWYILGEVRSCAAGGSENLAFLVEIQIQDTHGWRSNGFVPR